MNIVDLKNVDDCFDGSLIYELLFDEVVRRAVIFALGKEGDMQYFPNFAKPFFKIRVHGLYDVKGIEGSPTMRIHLKSIDRFTLDDFLAKIAAISNSERKAASDR